MEREQIIKALECCTGLYDDKDCTVCPIFNNKACAVYLLQDALSLIKELTEENEKLTINMNAYGLTVKRLAEENENLHASCTELARKMQDNVRAENEELRKLNEYEARKLKADTVRNMQERINASFCPCCEYDGHDVKRMVDQIAKDMLEGAGNG